METFRHLLSQIKDFLDIPILSLGQTRLTLWVLLYTAALLLVLLYVTARIKSWIVEGLLSRTGIDIGVRQVAGSITRYALIVVGLLIILQTAGIDLTTLNVLAGALGIGVGFGLQNVVNNFVSSLIILFERPIKLGDRIEMENVAGKIVRIGARSTTVLTNDNIAIIVPNSKFITESIVNWSHTENRVRFKIPVTVGYRSDPRLVEQLLLEIARKNPDVLDTPPPGVRFLRFGDNGLDFELRAWSSTLLHYSGKFISAINFGIHDTFKTHGIEVPTPQREIHIRGGSVWVKPDQ